MKEHTQNATYVLFLCNSSLILTHCSTRTEHEVTDWHAAGQYNSNTSSNEQWVTTYKSHTMVTFEKKKIWWSALNILRETYAQTHTHELTHLHDCNMCCVCHIDNGVVCALTACMYCVISTDIFFSLVLFSARAYLFSVHIHLILLQSRACICPSHACVGTLLFWWMYWFTCSMFMSKAQKMIFFQQNSFVRVFFVLGPLFFFYAYLLEQRESISIGWRRKNWSRKKHQFLLLFSRDKALLSIKQFLESAPKFWFSCKRNKI